VRPHNVRRHARATDASLRSDVGFLASSRICGSAEKRSDATSRFLAFWQGADREPARGHGHSARRRGFDINRQHCPNRGAGKRKIITAIQAQRVIETMLTHLGLDPQPA